MREENLVQWVKRLKDDLVAMKTTQPLSGDAWRVYRGRTANPWDLTIGPGVASNFSATYKVTYNTTDTNSSIAFAVIMSQPESSSDGYGYNLFPAYDDPCSAYYHVWADFGWTSSSVHRVKFTAFSPYDGTISVTPV